MKLDKNALWHAIISCGENPPSLDDLEKFCKNHNFVLRFIGDELNNLQRRKQVNIENLSGILSNYVWLQDDNFSRQKEMPLGIVVHSGDRSPAVAEYAEHEGDGRKISYHFAWHSKKEEFVQMVSIHDRAWHAGREGNDWIGIALPGPYDSPRSDLERMLFQGLVHDLLEEWPEIKYWTRHSDITQGKKDPGPGFTADWLDGIPLEHVTFATNRMARKHGNVR